MLGQPKRRNKTIFRNNILCTNRLLFLSTSYRLFLLLFFLFLTYSSSNNWYLNRNKMFFIIFVCCLMHWKLKNLSRFMKCFFIFQSSFFCQTFININIQRGETQGLNTFCFFVYSKVKRGMQTWASSFLLFWRALWASQKK